MVGGLVLVHGQHGRLHVCVQYLLVSHVGGVPNAHDLLALLWVHVLDLLWNVYGLWNGRSHDLALVHSQDLWDHQG